LSRERLTLAAPVRAARLLAGDTASTRTALLERARAEGELRGRAEAAALFERAAERLGDLEESLHASLARTAAELALEIARSLVRRELAQGQYDLERIVRETLAESGVGRGACVVHLHPADCARLEGVKFRAGTRLEPDPGVARGDVHLETALGLLVRDVDHALEAIAKRLHEEL
jgi:flagellar biosynthesis/type III secretory pathway protein FliH